MRSGVGAIWPRCRPADFFPLCFPDLVLDLLDADFVPADFVDVEGLAEPADLPAAEVLALPLADVFAEECFLCVGVVAAAAETPIAPMAGSSSAMRMVLRAVIGLRNCSPHCSKNAARNLPDILRERPRRSLGNLLLIFRRHNTRQKDRQHAIAIGLAEHLEHHV